MDIGLNPSTDCPNGVNCDMKDHSAVMDDTIIIHYDDDSNEDEGENVSTIDKSTSTEDDATDDNNNDENKNSQFNPVVVFAKVYNIILNPLAFFKQSSNDTKSNEDITMDTSTVGSEEKEPKLTPNIPEFPKPSYVLPDTPKENHKSTDDEMVADEPQEPDEPFPVYDKSEKGKWKNKVPRVFVKDKPKPKLTSEFEDLILVDRDIPEDELLKDRVNDAILVPYEGKYLKVPNEQTSDKSVALYKKNPEPEMLYDFWEFSIPNIAACPKDGKDLYLMIAIHSHVKNFEQRKAIRDTWGRVAKLDGVNYVFILGFDIGSNLDNQIKHESDTYSDIILVDLNDEEKNDTAKSVMFLKWVKFYCSEVKYIFKTNDDVFVNVPVLAMYIQREKLEENTMYGYLYKDYLVERNSSKPNYLTHQQYEYDVLPDYLSSEGYLFSGKLAPILYKKALYAPYINQENVFITGILAEELLIKRNDIPLFSLTYPDLPKTEKCSIFIYAFVFHPVLPKGMRWFWNDLKKTGFICGMFLENAAKVIPKERRMYPEAKYLKLLYPILAGEPTDEPLEEPSSPDLIESKQEPNNNLTNHKAAETKIETDIIGEHNTQENEETHKVLKRKGVNDEGKAEGKPKTEENKN